MKRSPRLTIGLPVYNGGRFLGEAMRSILEQSFGDFELVVSDNASTDDTEQIARGFTSRDPRVRYHRNPENVGLSRNFNRVFRTASAPLFKWATGDDVLLPGCLERCVRVLDERPDVVLACTRVSFVDHAGTPQAIEDRGWSLMGDEAHERLRYVIHANHWANSILGIIRSSALERTRLLPDYAGGDYRLLAELSLLGKFHESSEMLYLRRLHPGSSSQFAKDERRIAEYIAGRQRRVRLPAWSRTFDNVRIVWRSDLPGAQKLGLWRSIAGTIRARRDRLWREIVQGMTPFLRRSP